MENMKLKILALLLMSLLNFGCQVGTRADSCKSDLRRADALSPSKNSCELLQFIVGFVPTNIDFLILNCYQYQVKIRECEKEGNRYTPALYSRE
ncbi:hypothetical protein BWD14_13995 [Leptospira santarosai]|uniref:Lipoprotein n=2 Tax=Leptospira santarosai TaxID=28183 RepID=A0AB73LTM9_9LEPT|nr:Uncharacterized protein XB17_00533 [Leptospira santarosai]ONF92318.1 hypothetical protein BWD14_13995 [Leptospira santarosai]